MTVAFCGGYEETLRRVAAVVAEGGQVDVMVAYSGMLRALLETQMLVPLDDLITANGGAAFLADFLPGVMLNARVDDRCYGLPLAGRGGL